MQQLVRMVRFPPSTALDAAWEMPLTARAVWDTMWHAHDSVWWQVSAILQDQVDEAIRCQMDQA